MEFIGGKIIAVILGLFFALTVYININSIYYVILSFFGFGKAKRDYEIIDDQTKFLILVAAHNEEKVIESTINNLKKINYRKDLYDIYVVNDNSTDSTGDICEEMGIKHIDTIEGLYPREGVGKPAGLQYALRSLGFEKLKDQYDVLMILDADNHVDADILKELNSQFIGKGKPEAIQSYLDSKNSTSTLSLGYAMSYYLTNRFFQLAKYRVGLPNAIGGTGFIVRMDYLMKHGGFRFHSLTEDLELEMEIVKDNGRVLWNHFVRIYDEKPDKLKISIRQRTRWSQGHWYVAFTNFLPFMKKLIMEKGKHRILDQIFYLFGMARAVQMTVVLIAILISFGYGVATRNFHSLPHIGGQFFVALFGLSIFTIFLFVYQFFGCLWYAIKTDTKLKLRPFSMIISMFYYAYTFIYAQAVGLIKWRQQHTWVKTEHNKTAKMHRGNS